MHLLIDEDFQNTRLKEYEDGEILSNESDREDTTDDCTSVKAFCSDMTPVGSSTFVVQGETHSTMERLSLQQTLDRNVLTWVLTAVLDIKINN